MNNFHSKRTFASAFSLFLALVIGWGNPQYVKAQACAMVCNDLITVEVPINGSTVFAPLDMLEGDPAQNCPNGIFSTQAQVSSAWIPATGNMVFDQTHIGQTFQARVRDQVSGNTCWGNVQVVAAPLMDTIHFQLCTELWKDARPIKGTQLIFQPNNPAFPYSPMIFQLDNAQSCVDITLALNDFLPGTTFSYGASLPDTGYLNGVNLMDLCATRRHILGISPFTSPYALIAADANQSGSVTTFDLVESRKLMLGVYSAFPNNQSWRFFPDYCQFPNPNNPFMTNCETEISLSELIALNGTTAKVIGTKIGDVNGDVTLNNEAYQPPSVLDSFSIILPQGPILAGATLLIPVKLNHDLVFGGLQLNFQVDQTIASVVTISGAAISLLSPSSEYAFNPTTGVFRVSTMSDLSQPSVPIQAGETLFFIHMKTTQNAQIEDILELVYNPQIPNFWMGSNCQDYYSLDASYSGSVGTYAPELPGLRVQMPSPNPFDAQTTLSIELESAETAILEVVDLTGRILFSEEKQLSAGLSHWEIPGTAMNAGGLGIWRLRVGDQMLAGKLAKK